MGEDFIGEHVDRFHDFALVVLRDTLGEVNAGDGELGDIGDQGSANSVDLGSVGFADEDTDLVASWPAFNNLGLHVFQLLHQTRRPRRPPFFLVPS